MRAKSLSADLIDGRRGVTFHIILAMLALAPFVRGQQSTVTPQESGMTSGLPGVSAARQAEMMQVRAQSQKARAETEAAAMQRAAEEALDKKMQDRTLQEARETKALKQQAASDLQFQKAGNAFQGVRRNEIKSWSDDSGRVSVQRGVPPEILAAIPPEEETPVEEDDGKFHPLKMPGKAAKGAANAASGAAGAAVGGVKKALSWRPFGKKDDAADPAEAPVSPFAEQPRPAPEPPPNFVPAERLDLTAQAPQPQPQPAPVVEEKKGVLKGIASNLPLIGKKNAEPDPLAVQPGSTVAAEPAEKKGLIKGIASNIPLIGKKDAGGPGETVAAAPEAEKPGMFSKLPLIGKKDKPSGMETPAPAPTLAGAQGPAPAEPRPATTAAAAGSALFGPVGASSTESGSTEVGRPSVAANTGASGIDKPGFMDRMKNFAGKIAPGNNNKGVAAPGPGGIDASLFPQSDDPDQLMAANPVSRSEIEQTAAAATAADGASTGNGNGKPRLKMPQLPKLSAPSLPSLVNKSEPELNKAPEPKIDRSTTHSGGSDLYVVQAGGAQFMQFGADPLSSEAVTLSAGTMVKMTKAGDEWCSVQLSSGASGIVPNKALKPATSSGAAAASAGGGTALAPTASAPGMSGAGTSGRISRTVSATGAGVSDIPGPPVTVPGSEIATLPGTTVSSATTP